MRAYISIHALLAESDRSNQSIISQADDFYPRSPCGERRAFVLIVGKQSRNFYPRSPCGERPRPQPPKARVLKISIHALLAESDGKAVTTRGNHRHFYPRSPCGERQDTPSISTPNPDFYPRSPCGERPLLWRRKKLKISISIHALLAESDLFLRSGPMTRRYFYPRSPCGERPAHFARQIHKVGISIHALLAESDRTPASRLSQQSNFYPRSPCGERRRFPPDTGAQEVFLSTLSLRRATRIIDPTFGQEVFLSTLSLRRATTQMQAAFKGPEISIHALLAESDQGTR